ncbi:type I restriction enzyme HsdR N-terminal domain-containing protein [Flavihumibacter fluvii]|uniref:type I restriction enzyme HsdR N-terminal domain-containing protein n=1 Tax=Flavihumibacter fluvii TaxID=2838157 RepID=UPI001BDE19A2|nr:type I restriction enzyme HsdR N-terminal domain-containing protein [Flavihumibacter fluvii]ULQ54814.1 type I restriction enzyme HsdR N-terminal domain-containing protein [Flavihumibacter fluvii]
MINLVFPDYPFRMREMDGKHQIFDEARKRWVAFTPEEWVRQNFLQYLFQEMNYPASLIAVEKEMQLGELSKRFDILVYNQQHKPWMMVECKSMDVTISDAVVHQVLRYNMAIPVRYLVVTNGRSSWFFEKKNGRLEALLELPAWREGEE